MKILHLLSARCGAARLESMAPPRRGPARAGHAVSVAVDSDPRAGTGTEEPAAPGSKRWD